MNETTTEPQAQSADADQHFDEGNALIQNGRFIEEAAAYRRALALKRDARRSCAMCFATSTIAIAVRYWNGSNGMSKNACARICASGIACPRARLRFGASAGGFCTGTIDCTRFPPVLAGPVRMPRGEGHRKAVCGRTACTV